MYNDSNNDSESIIRVGQDSGGRARRPGCVTALHPRGGRRDSDDDPIGDSERRLGAETRSGDSDRRLGAETRNGDSDRRLGTETRSGDSERRLRSETRSGDSERRRRLLTARYRLGQRLGSSESGRSHGGHGGRWGLHGHVTVYHGCATAASRLCHGFFNRRACVCVCVCVWCVCDCVLLTLSKGLALHVLAPVST